MRIVTKTLAGLFTRREIFMETKRGFDEHVPERISGKKDLTSFISRGHRNRGEMGEEEKIVYLIADAEIVISSGGFAAYFSDRMKLETLPDLINALKTIGEPHTLSVINDFINLVRNRDLPFDAESVALYMKEHLYIAKDWNEKFLKHSGSRWQKIGAYLAGKPESPDQTGHPVLH